VPMISTSVLKSAIWPSLGIFTERLRRAGQAAPNGEKLDAGPLREQAPQAARRKQHDGDADQAEHHQVPRAVSGQQLLQDEEDDERRWGLERADAADDVDEET